MAYFILAWLSPRPTSVQSTTKIPVNLQGHFTHHWQVDLHMENTESSGSFKNEDQRRSFISVVLPHHCLLPEKDDSDMYMTLLATITL